MIDFAVVPETESALASYPQASNANLASTHSCLGCWQGSAWWTTLVAHWLRDVAAADLALGLALGVGTPCGGLTIVQKPVPLSLLDSIIVQCFSGLQRTSSSRILYKCSARCSSNLLYHNPLHWTWVARGCCCGWHCSKLSAFPYPPRQLSSTYY